MRCKKQGVIGCIGGGRNRGEYTGWRITGGRGGGGGNLPGATLPRLHRGPFSRTRPGALIWDPFLAGGP